MHYIALFDGMEWHVGTVPAMLADSEDASKVVSSKAECEAICAQRNADGIEPEGW